METTERSQLEQERYELLHQIEEWLETPMLVLGFVWLVLLLIELTRGLSPILETASYLIWFLFIIDFALRFTLAPNKQAYLKGNWLTVISLMLPALRTLRAVRALRLLRAARATRGLRLVKVIGSLNRGMRTLGAVMGRRGFRYVATLTIVVTVVGAAGMYAFESGTGGLPNYGTALWWTAMLMTTLGSEYWPQSPEGRTLTFLLALYAFAVFGYVTAAIATYFVGRDAESDEGELASAESIKALQVELAALRAQLVRVENIEALHEELTAIRAQLNALTERMLETEDERERR